MSFFSAALLVTNVENPHLQGQRFAGTPKAIPAPEKLIETVDVKD